MKLKSKIFVIAFAIFSSHIYCQNITNEGTDFWFSFTEMYDLSSATYEAHISSRSITSGTVTIPGTGFFSNFNVIPGAVTIVSLPAIDMTNTVNGLVVSNKVVHVTSNNPISVYAMTDNKFRTEASLVLPTSALGTKYFISTKPTDFTTWSFDGQFSIVAAGATCTVQITPTETILDPITGPSAICNAGVPYTITLNSGECYQLQTVNAGEDLTGTIIEAVNGTDKFSVFSGHNCATILAPSAYDPLYAAEYPTNTWGKNYIVPPIKGAPYSEFQVVASEDNTIININGTIVNLNQGDFHEDTLSIAKVISGNKPIKVTHFLPSGQLTTGSSTFGYGDPSMTGILPNEQMLVDSITFSQLDGSIDSGFVAVVTRTSDIGTVTLNGTALTGWITIPQSPSYSYCIKQTTLGDNNVRTTGCGFVAYAYGIGDRESYYYTPGAVFNSLDDSIMITNQSNPGGAFCSNDILLFETSASGNILNYNWEFGDGDNSSLANPTHAYQDTGQYNISLVLTYNCYTDTLLDTIVIEQCCITDTIGFTYTYPDPCDSSIVEFTPTSTGQIDSVEWWMGFPGGAGLTDMIPIVNFPQIKTYNINLWVYGLCGWVDTIIPYVQTYANSTPNYWLSHNINYCFGDPLSDLIVTDTTGFGGTITWYSDAALTINIGTGTTLSPSISLGSYVYYATETLACGERLIDSVVIQVINCLSCDGNLVPNPGFETYTSCPQGEVNNALQLAPPWNNPPLNSLTASTDLLNSCYGALSITPHTGNGNIQIATYNDWCEYREYAQAPLTQTLVQGKCYQASMHTAFASYRSNYSIDSIGMYFSVGAPAAGIAGECDPNNNPGVLFPGRGLINVSPQITNDVLVDMTTSSWQLVTGTFIANGNEDFVTIGNFTSDINISPTWIGPWPQNIGTDAIYLIDDICLYEIPADTTDAVALSDTTNCSPITLTAPSGYNVYHWKDLSNITVSSTQNYIVSDTGTSVYILYYADTTICPLIYYRDTISVSINIAPVAGNDLTIAICTQQAAFNLFDSIPGIPDTGGIWLPGLTSGTNIFDPITDIVGTYQYIAGVGSACEPDTAAITITFNQIPVPTASSDSSYCVGDVLADITALGTGTINWYSDNTLTTNIGTGSILTPLNTIGTSIYYVNQTINGCESAPDSVTIIINDLPEPPIAISDSTYCDGDLIADITASGTGTVGRESRTPCSFNIFQGDII